MKILITGANGFLGRNVVEAFQKYNVSLLTPGSSDLDLLDKNSTLRYFKGMRPTHVLHLAAVCGGILANKQNPADFIHLNTEMTSNIFNAAYHYLEDVKYLYSLGSVCSYPKYCPVPFKEDDIWNGYPEETNAPYGVAKRLQMSMQQAYRQQYNLKGAHFIPVNMYGQHDHFNLGSSHVIPALIRKFVEAVEQNKSEVFCWGTGEATREFLYAGDCADALTQAVVNDFDYPLPINLGTGVSISIFALAHLIGGLTGYQGDIIFTGEVSDGQPRRQLNVERAKETLGFVAQTDLETGLIKTIEWFKNHREY